MRHLACVIAVSLAATGGTFAGSATAGPDNFVFFNLDRQRISEKSFLETEAVVGAQLKYTWRELEPERDRYELGPLLADLAFLEEHGKRLFIQLQDVSFDERLNVPDYLVEDPEFHGGAARKYEREGDGDNAVIHFDGWVARRWDPAVIGRFAKLLQAIGKATGGRLEGVNLPETSIGFGGMKHSPEDFTFQGYVEGVKAMMTAAREALPDTHIIQYANFMPGEWLPWEDHGYLQAVYEHAEKIGVGVGGPDMLPHRRGQQNHPYKFIAARGESTVAGLAVQDGNLAEKNPKTKQPVTATELYAFAKDKLRADYLFWGTQEPYYTKQVLPLLNTLPADRQR